MPAAVPRPLAWVACLCALGLVARGPAFAPGRQARVFQGAPARSARTQLGAKVKDPLAYGAKKGPVVTYANALIEAAAKKGASVQVTKDVMRMKKLMSDQMFQREYAYLISDPGTPGQIDQVQGYKELFGPYESDIVPKFIGYLAKKRRLPSLPKIIEHFMVEVYEQQGIQPVNVITATPLTDEQAETIKAKMKAKLGATDIKLSVQVNPTLMAGMIVEYGYEDPEDYADPWNRMDLSLQTVLRKAALQEGVLV